MLIYMPLKSRRSREKPNQRKSHEALQEEHVAADDVSWKAQAQSKRSNKPLNSQRDWAQTIKQMSLKLDNLGSRPSQINNANGQTTEPVSSGNTGVDSQLQAINTKLDNILHKLDTAAPGGPGSSEKKNELLEKIFDLEEQSNRHEMFLSEQIEELRHLISTHHPIPGWSVGTIVVLFGAFKVVQKIIKSRKSNNFGSDEGSYFLNTNGPGHSNSALSMTMDTFGFRQRIVPESTANNVPQMLSDVVPTTNEEMGLNLQ
ncbi:hypothetical protein PGT21_002947 [Puccinia graminis f. sp. tritici]|uniref:Uncharacterized protein n=1 Tax=Puccinia graminis f. sp. tritici TaxID=56615 RepID=A0A5B0NMH2_PUCGR|nr:hypothetical protein PGT21_002947 [Puccinia graminis f. sp. tritici]